MELSTGNYVMPKSIVHATPAAPTANRVSRSSGELHAPERGSFVAAKYRLWSSNGFPASGSLRPRSLQSGGHALGDPEPR